MSFDRSKPSVAAGPASQVVRNRSGRRKIIILLSWIVGITGSFLTAGIVGVFADDLPPIHMRTLEGEIDETPMDETSMAELMAMGDNAAESTEPEPVETLEIPEVVETPPENLDLPEIAEAMTAEDIFAVPTAPKIEDALRPVDPEKRQLTPTPKRTKVGPVATSKGTGASSTQAGTAGGSGIGSGTGKGRFPPPPYPEFARSAGMQGTVRLSISVSAAGVVEGVSVISSTGYSSLDESAASWVRRNFRWPASATSHRHTLPLTFRLN